MASQSGLLDQILLEDIARHCPQQFLSFHQCMTKPVEDPNQCQAEQVQLAGCIKGEVPSFHRIQGICSGKLQAYDACLRMNGPNKCADDLQALRDCALGSLDK